MLNTPLLVDSFTFFNEIELLKFRLEYLNEVVDYFIIVEAEKTFSGNKKELFFENNKYAFEKYKDKIIHVIADLSFKAENAWSYEKAQRNSIINGIEQIPDLQTRDLITITDLDEIPDKNTLLKIKEKDVYKFNAHLEMDLYFYNINCKNKNKWCKAKLLTYDIIKECPNIDLLRMVTTSCVLSSGGWHFSYFGDVEFIKNKIKSFSHQEYNNGNFLDDEKIKSHIINSSNLLLNTDDFFYCPVNKNPYLPEGYERILHFSNILTTS